MTQKARFAKKENSIIFGVRHQHYFIFEGGGIEKYNRACWRNNKKKKEKKKFRPLRGLIPRPLVYKTSALPLS